MELDRWEVDGGFYSNDHATTLIMDTDRSPRHSLRPRYRSIP